MSPRLQARFAGNAALAVDLDESERVERDGPHLAQVFTAAPAPAYDLDDVPAFEDAGEADEDLESAADEFSVPDEFDAADYEIDDDETGVFVEVDAAPEALELEVHAEDALTDEAPENLPEYAETVTTLEVADVEDEEPPFDPPSASDAADEEPPFDPPSDVEDEEPPFDPPAEVEPAAVKTEADDQDALVLVEQAPPPRPRAFSPELREAPEAAAVCRPAPPISIHVAWESPDAAQLAATLSSDRRLAQALMSESNGGLERAAQQFLYDDGPDLLIVDTSLAARPLLAAFDRAKAALKPDAKVIVIGRVNDVALLRELLRRGASHYLLGPVDPDQLVRLICDLYKDADNARVIAVVGARGGVGASTVALNLTWCIGARRQAATALVDLDLSFGAAAFGFDPGIERSATVALGSGEFDEDTLEQAALRPHPRVKVFPAPASLSGDGALEPGAVQALIDHLRRTSAFVVLDLPHAWSGGVRQALSMADEVVLVATPDLASMRNAKNMLDALKRDRHVGREPKVVLSMVAAPKRPEIAPKEFAEAIGADPVCTLFFDAGVFGLAEIKNLPLDEVAPHSKQAALLDALAGDLSGLKPKPAPVAAQRPSQQAAAPAQERLELSLDMRVEPPPPSKPATPPEPPPPAPTLPVAAKPEPAVRTPSAPRRPKSLRRLASEPRRRRGRPGTLRAAAAVVALGIAGGWFLGQSGFHPEIIRNYLNALTVEQAG